MVPGVAAALAVDDAGVTGLVTGKAEVVELLNHLPLGDVLIQAAVGVGAFVLGILVCELGEAVLGLVAGVELGKDLLGARLGCGLGLVGVGAVCGLLSLYEDMAHGNGVIVVVVTAEEHDDVIAGLAAVYLGGDVTGLAAGVLEPIGRNADAAAGDAGNCIRGAVDPGLGERGVELLFALKLIVGLVVGCDYRIGLGLGGVKCFGGDGLGIVAVGVLSRGLLSLYEVVGIAERIPGILVLFVLCLKLIGAVFERILLLGACLVGKSGVYSSAACHLDRHTLAVVRGEHLIGAGVALKLCHRFKVLKVCVDIGYLILGKLDAVCLGIVAQSLDLKQFILSCGQELLFPCAAVGAGLLAEASDARGGIKAEQRGIAAVLVGGAVILRGIVVAELGGGIAPVAYSIGRGLIQDPGVKENNKRDQQHDADGTQRPASLALRLFAGLFLRGQHLLVSTGFAGGLTVLLLGRCTHLMSSHPLRNFRVMRRSFEQTKVL